jgi:hypothetical protein
MIPLFISASSPIKGGGNIPQFRALYNDFRKGCQTKKDFITHPFSGVSVWPGQSVDALFYAPYGFEFREGVNLKVFLIPLRSSHAKLS